jgi:hypothetical protein
MQGHQRRRIGLSSRHLAAGARDQGTAAWLLPCMLCRPIAALRQCIIMAIARGRNGFVTKGKAGEKKETPKDLTVVSCLPPEGICVL